MAKKTAMARTMAGLAVAGLLVSACESGPSPEVQAQLDQLAAIQAENDALLSEVAAASRMMTEINENLDAVEGLEDVQAANSESPMDVPHRRIVAKVEAVTQRLSDAEARIAQSRQQLQALNLETDSLRVESDSLRERAGILEQSLSDFEAVIGGQRRTLEGLYEELLTLENQYLALRDTVETIVEEQNRAYYVIGTKDELLERGIIVKEGGSRVLFIFGKRGETLSPARTLDPADFTEIDMRSMTEIPLPDDGEYTIASRQDLNYMLTPVDEDNKITGSIAIDEPEEFWMPSRFLIVVKT